MDKTHIIESDDTIVIEDEGGKETTYNVDAVIEMNGKQYVLYSDGDEIAIKEIVNEKDDQYLEDVSDEHMEELIDAYQKALEEDS